MRILYIEDSPDDVANVRRIANYFGHTLVVAATGAQAQASVGEKPPDLILVDINLPDANGLELTRRWRQEGFAMPIVAITSDLIRYSDEQAQQAGCDAFLAKPVSVEEMTALFTRFNR